MMFYYLASLALLFVGAECGNMNVPWTGLLRPPQSPSRPATVDVRLYCHTRGSKKEHKIILLPSISLNGCPFSDKKKTVFVTHGFACSGGLKWLADLKNAYLEREDVNVFIVYWGQAAELFNPLQASFNTLKVGDKVASFIKYLVNEKHMSPNNLHLIGHSLGAQISSNIAKRTKEEFRRVVNRITALDPANPAFVSDNHRVRLDKSDATFVDVIHTSGAPLIPDLGFGFMSSAGHVDIYMNGGMKQPGCVLPKAIPKIKTIEDLSKLPVELKGQVRCSHCLATELFTAALRTDCKIWAKRVVRAGTRGFSEPDKKCTAHTCLSLGLETPTFPGRGVFVASTTPSLCADCKVSKKIVQEMKSTSPGLKLPLEIACKIPRRTPI